MAVLDLSRSETRRRLLTLLFTDVERERHFRDLQRLTGMSIGAVQHVVGGLEREGWLKRRRLGNLALFSVNRRHPLYPELEALVGKTIGIAPMLMRALAAVPGIRLAFIYGSHVPVLPRPESAWASESDVDLLVVGEVDARAISRVTRDMGTRTGRPINYTVLGVKEMIAKIARRDSFIAGVLSKPILPLAGFGKAECAVPIRRRPEHLVKLLERPE